MSQPTPDLVFLRIGGREYQREAPAGFWELPPEHRVAYIEQAWPDAHWAGNGVPGLRSKSHNLMLGAVPGLDAEGK